MQQAFVFREAEANKRLVFQATERVRVAPKSPNLSYPSQLGQQSTATRWGFQIFFIFTPTWGRFPF